MLIKDMAYATVEDRIDRLEALFGQLMAQLAMSDKRAEERHKAAEERHKVAEERHKAAEERHKAAEGRNMSADERMAQFVKEMRQSKKELDKKWGDLANKMGTLVEDIVAPNLPRIGQENFHLGEPVLFITRSYAAKVGNPGSRREFDTIIFYDNAVIVNETKSNPKDQHVESFDAMLKEFGEYFPQAIGKQIIPIFASLSLPDSIVNLLTKKRIYGLAMGEDTMELVNHGSF